MNTNREYMIFNVSEINNVDFEEVLETSEDTVRKSIDGTKTFVKWEGAAVPTTVSSLTTKVGPYTHSEILAILATDEWTSDNPII